jgi:cytoskeleton protein RodZ
MSESQPSQGAPSQPDAPEGLASLAAAGARLAQLREAKGWSREDVSARLKVAPQKLAALESGDISAMPGTAFAMGVVRSYARILGVDPEPFAAALRREHGHPAVDLSMPASAGTGMPRGKVSLSLGSSSRHRPWLWALAAVVAVVVAAVVWLFSGGMANFPGHDKLIAAASEAQAGSAALEASTPAGASEEAAAASSAETASAPTQAASPVEAASAPAVAATVAAASAAVTPAPAPAPAAPAVSAAADQAASSAAPTAGQAVVTLKATQDSWFGVRDQSGKMVFQGLVHAGESQQVAATPPLKVTIGNTLGLGAITIDGKPVDPAKYANAQGNVARFTLP